MAGGFSVAGVRAGAGAAEDADAFEGGGHGGCSWGGGSVGERDTARESGEGPGDV